MLLFFELYNTNIVCYSIIDIVSLVYCCNKKTYKINLMAKLEFKIIIKINQYRKLPVAAGLLAQEISYGILLFTFYKPHVIE